MTSKSKRKRDKSPTRKKVRSQQHPVSRASVPPVGRTIVATPQPDSSQSSPATGRAPTPPPLIPHPHVAAELRTTGILAAAMLIIFIVLRLALT